MEECKRERGRSGKGREGGPAFLQLWLSSLYRVCFDLSTLADKKRISFGEQRRQKIGPWKLQGYPMALGSVACTGTHLSLLYWDRTDKG